MVASLEPLRPQRMGVTPPTYRGGCLLSGYTTASCSAKQLVRTFFALVPIHNYLLEFTRLIPNDVCVRFLPTLTIARTQAR
jgi:hypothetical protein